MQPCWHALIKHGEVAQKFLDKVIMRSPKTSRIDKLFHPNDKSSVTAHGHCIRMLGRRGCIVFRNRPSKHQTVQHQRLAKSGGQAGSQQKDLSHEDENARQTRDALHSVVV